MAILRKKRVAKKPTTRRHKLASLKEVLAIGNEQKPHLFSIEAYDKKRNSQAVRALVQHANVSVFKKGKKLAASLDANLVAVENGVTWLAMQALLNADNVVICEYTPEGVATPVLRLSKMKKGGFGAGYNATHPTDGSEDDSLNSQDVSLYFEDVKFLTRAA